jgi:hypothetical protein
VFCATRIRQLVAHQVFDVPGIESAVKGLLQNEPQAGAD